MSLTLSGRCIVWLRDRVWLRDHVCCAFCLLRDAYLLRHVSGGGYVFLHIASVGRCVVGRYVPSVDVSFAHRVCLQMCQSRVVSGGECAYCIMCLLHLVSVASCVDCVMHISHDLSSGTCVYLVRKLKIVV